MTDEERKERKREALRRFRLRNPGYDQNRLRRLKANLPPGKADDWTEMANRK